MLRCSSCWHKLTDKSRHYRSKIAQSIVYGARENKGFSPQTCIGWILRQYYVIFFLLIRSRSLLSRQKYVSLSLPFFFFFTFPIVFAFVDYCWLTNGRRFRYISTLLFTLLTSLHIILTTTTHLCITLSRETSYHCYALCHQAKQPVQALLDGCGSGLSHVDASLSCLLVIISEGGYSR